MSYTATGSPYAASSQYTGLRKRIQNSGAFGAPAGAGASPPPGAAPRAAQPSPMGSPGMAAGAPMTGAAPRPAMAPAAAPPMSPAPAPAMGGVPMAAPSTMGAPGRDMLDRGRNPGGGGGESGYDRDPWGIDNPEGKFKIRNPQQWQKFMQRLQLKDYGRASGPLWEQIQSLLNDANESQFSDEKRAQFLAPAMENISDQFQGAQGQLDQSLMDRGLTDSSAMVQGQANLAGRAAGARSAAVNNLFQTEDESKDAARAQAMQALGAMQGRSIGGASDMANSRAQARMQQIMAALQMDQSGFDIGGLLGGLGGMLGSGGISGLAGLFGGGGSRGYQAGNGGGSNYA